MSLLTATLSAAIDQHGFAVLPGVFSRPAAQDIIGQLTAALADNSTTVAALRGDRGTVYAARNVLTLWPPAATVWRQAPLPAILGSLLGPHYGLVRVLFFDKPPEKSWALPWHKDLTIAVHNNRLPRGQFQRPTSKAGVPHVEAPTDVLQGMLTARIHLDDITEENGPLKVVPGSHQSGKSLALGAVAPQSILAGQGDVLLMRPLLAHCSNRSHAGTTRHRRILHLEFAASPMLSDGFAWHDFIPGRADQEPIRKRGQTP